MMQLVQPDRPAPDFAQLVMNEIFADARGQAATSPELKRLIQKAPIETPSAAFTYNAMKKIKLVGSTARNEPIISRKAWFIAASMVILSVLLVILTKAPENTSPIPPVLNNVLYHLYKFIEEVPSVCVLTLVCASTLLLVDYLLSERFVRARRASQ